MLGKFVLRAAGRPLEMRGALVVSCPMAGVLGSGACRPRACTAMCPHLVNVYAEASPCPPAMPPAARKPKAILSAAPSV